MKRKKRTEFIKALFILSPKDRRKIYATIFIQVILGLLDLVGIVVIGLVGTLAINGISNAQKGNRISQLMSLLNIENLTLQKQVAILGLGAALILVLKTLLTVYFTKKTVYFLSSLAAIISKNLVNKLLTTNLTTIQKRSVQNTIYAITQGVSAITVGVIGTNVTLISDLSLLIILSFGLFIVDPLIAFSTLALFGMVGLILHFIMNVRVKEIGKKQSLVSIESQERISELIHAYREISVGNRKAYYSSEINRLRSYLSKSQAELSYLRYASKFVIEITVVIGALTLAAFQFLTQTASHAVGVLSIFLVASTRIGPAVLRVQQGLLAVKANVGNARPTYQVIEELRDVSELEVKHNRFDIEHYGFKGCISVKSVYFKYEQSSNWALNNVNLEINHGEVVAIVGPSGAGKTTLVDLILGVLKADTGEILISGKSPREAVEVWPGAIAYVPQDVVITNGTIKSNVALGLNQSEDLELQIKSVLKVAQLGEFVENLPLGINEKVGDRGTKLSGGQRQRLGIARALLTEPILIVFDEATSALDGETEMIISKEIMKLKGTKTLIIIAHRLSTIREADKIVYMSGGEIISTGSLKEVRNRVPEFENQARLMGL